MKQENENTFTHLGLFEGIGGFSLAARWMGWETVAYSEINPFCLKVLKHHFPKADVLTDIKTTDFKPYANRIDIITGGFPCQPYSVAGKRKGKDDERHLWPEMLRAIREVKPRFVVGENVGGIISWDGGLVFNEVQTDLEAEGYEVQPFLLPACAKNAPHRRDRVWFIAYSNRNGERLLCRQESKITPEAYTFNSNISGQRVTSNTNNAPAKHSVSTGWNLSTSTLQQNTAYTERGSQQGEYKQRQMERKFRRCKCKNNATYPYRFGWFQNNKEQQAREFEQNISNWRNFPTQSPICNGDDGLSGKLDSITFPKWRNESIKAGGNAIVPQVAYEIFKALQQI